MPNMAGGDQCSKDYAPHMWIGDDFIKHTGKEVKVNGYIYKLGQTESGKIVCERYPISKEFFATSKDRKPVLSKDFPEEVKEIAKELSFQEEEEKHAKFVEESFGKQE